jgi:hypothetical protein
MRTRRRLAVIVAVGAVLLAVADLGRARAHGVATRVAEPITLSGADLAPFHGATEDTLWVYAWDEGAWVLVPSQLDERDAQGQIVAHEDGQLDANDTLVFMSDVLGQQRSAADWPPDVSRAHPPIELEVKDPLEADFDGYVYVFWSDQAPYPSVPQHVQYDAAHRELHSDYYTLGFADPADPVNPFVGLRRLSLYGGSRNLIDRLKIRADVTYLTVRSTVDEESLAALGGALFDPQPVKTGRVRVVLDAQGTGMAYAQRVDLFRGLDAIGQVQPPIGTFELHGLRVSLDMAAGLGDATYRDANLPGGVAIDGKPDVVPSGPLPAWRELDFEEGVAVLLKDASAVPSAATVYYKDDATVDAADTGDKKSFGDNGVAAATLNDFNHAGFPGQLVVLPVGGHISAAQLADNAAHPLTYTLRVGELPPTATPGGDTATPPPTRTATAPPTVPPKPAAVYLPVAWRP